MNRFIVVASVIALWSIPNIAMTQTGETQQAVQTTPFFKVFKAPQNVNMQRVVSLAQALDFAIWPETKALFTTPIIRTTLLEDPSAVTQSAHSCTWIPFGDKQWDKCRWSWRRLIENTDALPTKLPPEQREQILANLTAEQRKDPQLVSTHIKRHLERYQNRRRYLLSGQIDIEMSLTPGNLAAKEFMLHKLTDNMLPIEGVIATYQKANRPEGLGTVSYAVQSRNGDVQQVVFIRNNIFVSIRADGYFAVKAVPLARKIDSEIVLQPSVNMEDIQKHKIVK